ncbi:YceH family protein [Tichowtungia aerotolerans]|uniref:DUF480 domain-containing protein n=1 Tax=Tichowtungia aerotolerans TaxID=2697043 RepID=A0A6P1M2W1_9BACT|nr:YceH family protein [Tichowtungia aerotolerans]QHI68171.1 DUF480 domain-containing protein [Tichowtungia aerotolerans]
MDALLNPVEARVLGALVEKEITTPSYYPLTLSSLAAACNQKSNRNPVTDLSDKDIARATYSLREKHLAWETAPAGSRVTKFSHNIQQELRLSDEQQAVLCELILRGPQTIGELRTHCERMHPLGDIAQAAEIIQSLVEHPDGALAVKLPREPGRRENRYAHLLCGEPEISEEPPAEIKPAAAVLEVRAENERIAELETQVKDLWSQMSELSRQFAEFKEQFD